MADGIRVMLEMGPKGKKVVAVAPDWPGLERGAKTEEAAIDRLRAYLPRYATVAKLAGKAADFPAVATVDVVEHYPGTGSLDRELTLLRACWAFFDDVRSRVSAELQKGPRGGGRDRDHIVRHVFANEQDWAKGLGVRTPDGGMLTVEGLQAHRDAYCQAIRDYHSLGKPAGKMAKRPLRYLIRHPAFHTLDHAWELEDKDLTVK